jgi:mitochondrial import receptor subunit TOM70
LLYSHLINFSDFTASTILDKFQNEAAAQSVERVLKKMSTAEAQEILKVSEPIGNCPLSEILVPCRLVIRGYLLIHLFHLISPHFALVRCVSLVSPFAADYESSGPPLTPPEMSTTGDNTLLLALEALGATDYAHAMTLANESLIQGISWDDGRAEALNLRGTFKYAIKAPISTC